MHCALFCSFFFCSWICESSLSSFNGWVIKYKPSSHVQLNKNRGDFLLQHGSYQTAVVQNLGGHRRSLQQGHTPKIFLLYACCKAIAFIWYCINTHTHERYSYFNKLYFININTVIIMAKAEILATMKWHCWWGVSAH